MLDIGPDLNNNPLSIIGQYIIKTPYNYPIFGACENGVDKGTFEDSISAISAPQSSVEWNFKWVSVDFQSIVISLG